MHGLGNARCSCYFASLSPHFLVKHTAVGGISIEDLLHPYPRPSSHAPLFVLLRFIQERQTSEKLLKYSQMVGLSVDGASAAVLTKVVLGWGKCSCVAASSPDCVDGASAAVLTQVVLIGTCLPMPALPLHQHELFLLRNNGTGLSSMSIHFLAR